MIVDPLAVFLVLALVVLASIWLEEHLRIAQMLGSALFAILLAAVLANVGVIPARSPTYGHLGGLGVSLAIALILLCVDFRTVLRAGPRMLIAFALGAVGTAAGALIAALVLAPAVGEETWKLAGQYTGTYTGGSVNFVSVGEALETSSDLFAAAVAADNVVTTLWVMVCFALPATLARWWPAVELPSAGLDPAGADTRTDADDRHDATRAAEQEFASSVEAVTLRDAAALVAVATGLVWLSRAIGSLVPGVPDVLWLTSLALLAAQVPGLGGLRGGAMLGNYLLHLFLAAIGAQSVLGEILRVGPAVLWFAAITVAVHGLLVLAGGRLLRIDLPTLAIASQANVGGPASAMALASAGGYPDRLLPGLATGLLGYAAGTYSGLAMATLVRGLLLG